MLIIESKYKVQRKGKQSADNRQTNERMKMDGEYSAALQSKFQKECRSKRNKIAFGETPSEAKTWKMETKSYLVSLLSAITLKLTWTRDERNVRL